MGLNPPVIIIDGKEVKRIEIETKSSTMLEMKIDDERKVKFKVFSEIFTGDPEPTAVLETFLVSAILYDRKVIKPGEE